MRQSKRTTAVVAAAVAALAVSSQLTHAASYTWDPTSTGTATGGGPGNWDTTSPIWFDGASDVAWPNTADPNPDEAIFTGATPGTVTLAAPILANTLTFQSDGYTVAGTSPNTLTLSGATPTVNVNGVNTTATLAVPLAGTSGLTKAGAGNLILAADNSALSGGLTVNGGIVGFSADATGNLQLGAAGNAITLNGGALSYNGIGNYTNSHVITFGASGGTLNILNSGAGGGATQGKITLAANQLAGSGGITTTGIGILSANAAQTYSGAGWTINGSTVEAANVAALGAASVPVTVNSGGELAAKQIIPNPITLNGGTIGVDSTNTTFGFSGAVTVNTDSKIRIGNFFNTTNQNVVISGPLSGSGNLTLINAAGSTASNANPNPAPSVFPSANVLTLRGNNTNYTGTVTVGPGQGLLMGVSGQATNITMVPANIVVKSTTAALPLINFQFNTVANGNGFIPAFTQDPTGTGEGVIGPAGSGLNSNQAIDMSTIAGGKWFFGTDNVGVSYFGVLKPANNVYKLTGGGGNLFLGSGNTLRDSNNNNVSASVVIGDTRVGATGLVRYGGVMSYSGSTTINPGSTLEMDFVNSGTANVNNLMPAGTNLTMNGGTFLALGRAGVATSQTMASITFNPGAASVQANANATSVSDAVNVNGITRNSGATVDFSVANTGSVSTTTANAGATGILGGYATFGGNTWATSAAPGDGATPGSITGLATANYATFATATSTSNVDVPAGNTTPGSVTVNTLRFNAAGGSTLNDTNNAAPVDTLTVASGGILETSAVGASIVVINSGHLATANGADLVIIQNNNNTMFLNSTVDGSIGLTKSGVGALVLDNPNTFTGDTNINGGALAVGTPLALQNSTVHFNVPVATANPNSLAFVNHITTATLGGITGNQYVNLTNDTGGAVAVSIGSNGQSTTYAGILLGSGSLHKVGAGTLNLTGSSTYTGGTSVDGGTLLVNNTYDSATGAGPVNVNAGGTLGGSGSVAGLVTLGSGATLSPGNSPGSITLTGGLTLTDGSALAMDLGATGADEILVTGGTVTGAVAPGSVAVNVTDAGGLDANQTYTLIDFTGATPSGLDASDFSLVTTAPITGAFNIVGNTLQLTTAAVPEPTTLLVLPAMACLMASRRRTRRTVK